MKIIFAGTPPFAAKALEALIQAGHEITLVMTQPDRVAGRGMSLKSSAVKIFAQSHGLSIVQPEKLKNNEEMLDVLKQAQADVMVVVAYGLILPMEVLEIPKYGCLNIHASLLPRWRGAAPIQRAIQFGDSQTGITIMQMDAGLDTGDMLSIYSFPISPSVTAGCLTDKLSSLGAKAIVETLSNYHSLKPIPQNGAYATYAQKILKAEAQVNWSLSAEEIVRFIHAFNPSPGAFTKTEGRILKLWEANVVEMKQGQYRRGEVIQMDKEGLIIATSKNAVRILSLQLSGAKKLSISEFVQGIKNIHIDLPDMGS